MRVLCLQEGGFRGGLHVAVLESLCPPGTIPYDLVLGTSVGALNGVLAAQGRAADARRIWESIDDPVPADGIRGFMRLSAGFNGESLLSLAPLGDMLVREYDPGRLRCLLGVGVVDLRTRRHHTLVARADTPPVRARRWVLASAAVPFVHDCPRWSGTSWGDGGLRNSFPPPPAGAAHIDVVLSHPMEPSPAPRTAVDGLWERAGVLVDCLTSTAQAADLAALRAHVHAGARVRVFAPREEIGGFLDASGNAIRACLRESVWMADNPIVL